MNGNAGRVDSAATARGGRSTPETPIEPEAGSRRPTAEPAPGSDRRSGASSGPTPLGAVDALPRALRMVGSIVAPTTLLTALFFYFGLMYAIGYYRHFGVNYTVLDLPSNAILILSASSAILPLALLSGTALLGLWVYRLPLDALSGRTRRRLHRWLVPAVLAVGLTLVAMSAVDALFGASAFPAGLWEARGLSLSVGITLLAYAAHLRRVLAPARSDRNARRSGPEALTVAMWGGVVVLICVGLFWAVGSYALRMGGQDAHGFAAGMGCAPQVILYSEKALNLDAAGVAEEQAAGPETGYRFRYPGLKLVPQAGENYLLLPGDWVQGASPAIVLRRSDSVRLEFRTANAPTGGC